VTFLKMSTPRCQITLFASVEKRGSEYAHHDDD